MNRKHIFFGIFALISTFFSACDEPERIPAYVRIEPFTVVANGGAAWQQITEGWLYANTELMGGFTLPAEVPVLFEGETELLVYPGVKANGSLNTPGIYPMFDRYTATRTLVPGETITLQPTVRYSNDVTFAWEESRTTLDGGSTIQFENRDGDAGSGFSLTETNAFSGKCLLLPVDTAHKVVEIATEKVTLPATGGQAIWLEMHHLNDIPFTLRLIGESSGAGEIYADIFLFNTISDGAWNKIYINLTDFVANLQEDHYRLYFRAELPVNAQGGYDQISGSVRLDNIRLIHF